MRLAVQGGIYSSHEVCGCGGGARADMESAPTGCGMPLYIPWALDATETATGRRGRRPLRSCCLPIHWFVGAAHAARGCTETLVWSRRAGHARPLPHDDIKKHKKPQLCVFCTAAALFTLFMRSHIRRHGPGTVVADVQDVAAAFAEAAVDGGLVGVQQVNGHKRLNGAGKAAAPADATRRGHSARAGSGARATGTPLLLRVLDAVGVLVELKAGVTAPR